ncbi:phosphatidate cytidylyltransferase [Amylibacter marinus]|uniref:Phosphatidate cytidylyltransferase n=1 Tax=Amylibacter marinus TaxID=1475483 RepID=A0ABQ5VST9_9RHOB|nr:phosphatidate cytidylyltransferase [Amylibacter marinus]GLQ34219.1 phosphatidate cytidylyltransferase [Amylibacter marinus]
MSDESKYADLKLRMLSGIVLVLVGAATLILGDLPFLFVFVLLAVVMTWEVVHLALQKSILNIIVPAMMGLSIMAYVLLSWPWALGYLALTLMVYCFALKPKDMGIRVVMMVVIFLGIIGLIHLRFDIGLGSILWVLACVVASDVGGYFAGRSFGGPKLWPAVSPKKTWSGTIGGWVLAAIVGLIFSRIYAEFDTSLALYGVVIAIFAQAGDLFESVLKRRAGIKDSSNLIPGHGGFLDRFDGVMGASLLVFIYIALTTNGLFA